MNDKEYMETMLRRYNKCAGIDRDVALSGLLRSLVKKNVELEQGIEELKNLLNEKITPEKNF